MSLPKSKYYTPRAMTVDGVSIDDKATHGYAGFSGAKKRVAEAGTAVINIQGVMSSLNKYINQQNHYMGYMDKLADINAVLANKEVKNIIGSLFGKEMNKRIEYEINTIRLMFGASFGIKSARIMQNRCWRLSRVWQSSSLLLSLLIGRISARLILWPGWQTFLRTRKRQLRRWAAQH